MSSILDKPIPTKGEAMFVIPSAFVKTCELIDFINTKHKELFKIRNDLIPQIKIACSACGEDHLVGDLVERRYIENRTNYNNYDGYETVEVKRTVVCPKTDVEFLLEKLPYNLSNIPTIKETWFKDRYNWIRSN